MLTDSIVARNVALAGPDFAWDGVKGSSRPPGYARRAQRAHLHAMQGGTCPHCGDALPDLMDVRKYEVSHVVAAGRHRLGHVRGNLMAAHPACNASVAPEWQDGVLVAGEPILWPSLLARPDVVYTGILPGPTAYKNMAARYGL